eukprot:2120342-Pleurochrysis_carterae.AAC.3
MQTRQTRKKFTARARVGKQTTTITQLTQARGKCMDADGDAAMLEWHAIIFFATHSTRSLIQSLAATSRDCQSRVLSKEGYAGTRHKRRFRSCDKATMASSLAL